MRNPFSLENKVILVTGASSGIGRGISILCSEMGARVIITGRNETRLKETFDMLYGDGHISIIADLKDDFQRNHLVEEIPCINGLVQCAGIGNRVPCKSVLKEDITNVFETNFNSPVMLQAELLRNKKIAKSASVVFVASASAKMPVIGNSLYSASKASLISYAQCLSLELAPRNIRVNCISPTMVMTELAQVNVSMDQLLEEQKKYPLQRYGQPKDIATLAVFLLSDASSWMTGGNVAITGGSQVL